MLMRITAVDYEIEDDLPVVQLAGRGENGHRITMKVHGMEPYLYVSVTEKIPGEYSHRIRRMEEGYESYDGVPLTKVVTKIPQDVEDIRSCVSEHYSADFPFYRRCSVDGLSGYVRVPEKRECNISEIETEITVSADEVIEPRIMIADIEVVHRGSGGFDEMMEEKSAPVTHITAWDSEDDKYYCLVLDPDDQIVGKNVKTLLESESRDSPVSGEVDRPISLRRYDTEEGLLSGFVKLVGDLKPDIASGWNFIDFDWQYLLDRIEKLDDEGNNNRYLSVHRLSDIGWCNGYQIERKVDCLPAFDMLTAYRKMTIPIEGRKRSYSLDYIGNEELGIGKLPSLPVAQSYDQDRTRLTAYNIMDVMLCTAIERKQKMHEFFMELADLSQVQIYDTFSEMRLIDGYIMSRSEDDEILPTAEEKDVPKNAGGLVLTPSDGIHEWVSVLDLKSLYPSCMITWNLSPETIHWYEDEEPDHEEYIDVPWLPDSDHSDGGSFGLEAIDFDRMWVDLREEGIVPKYLKQLFPERQKRKIARNRYAPSDSEYGVFDRQQGAVKVLMNAFYGVCSMGYWRLATAGLGDSITSSARYSLWGGKEVAEADGKVILYGDTDSIFVEIGESDDSKEECIERGNQLTDLVNDRIGEFVSKCGAPSPHPLLSDELHGTEDHALVYEFEKLYSRFFQPGSKKRYAGSIVWKEGKDLDGEIDITGFESQRSDSPEITEEVQPEVINRILNGGGFDEVSEYLQGIIGQIENEEMDLSRIALPKSLNQDLDEYGNTPAARACRFSNDQFGSNWIKGSDPWMIYVSETPPMTPKTDVIALGWDEEIPEGYVLDLNKTLERALERPLKPILDDIGWNFEELKAGAEAQSASMTGDDWGDYEMTTQSQQPESEWGW